MSKHLNWENPRGFFSSGVVHSNMSDEEFEMLRARLLVAKDVCNKLKVPLMPRGYEGQVVDLELLLEKPDTRSELEPKFQYSFDQLIYTKS